MAESAGAQAAFLSRVIVGFNTALHIAWQIAQLHPAVGVAASAYNLASGEGDIFDVLAVAGPAAKLIGKAMGSMAKVSSSYAAKGLNALCRTCLAEGTLVETSRGPLPIECLQVGDLVLSMPEEDPLATPQFMPITAVHVNESSELLTVTFDDDSTLKLTAPHEVYTTARGWGLAEDLIAGDSMWDRSSAVRQIRQIVRSYNPVPVYNLTVEGTHTFFADGVWVHNKCELAKKDIRKFAEIWLLKGPKEHPTLGKRSHGQEWFQDSQSSKWFTFDADGHNGGVWKVFDRQGNRLYTLDINGTVVGK